MVCSGVLTALSLPRLFEGRRVPPLDLSKKIPNVGNVEDQEEAMPEGFKIQGRLPARLIGSHLPKRVNPILKALFAFYLRSTTGCTASVPRFPLRM